MVEEQVARRQGPTVQGAFDEETCRWHLHQIGSAIVPDFPFRVGMQEIYGSLLKMYSIVQIADAMSVLHELLEDESYEGRIWRSWRHDWRRRNENLLDPFVPTVEGVELPQPTTRFIRSLKAANFFSTGPEAGDGISRLERSDLLAPNETRPSFVSCHSILQSLGETSSLTANTVRRSPLTDPEQHQSQSRTSLKTSTGHLPQHLETEYDSSEQRGLRTNCFHDSSEDVSKDALLHNQAVKFFPEGSRHQRTAQLDKAVLPSAPGSALPTLGISPPNMTSWEEANHVRLNTCKPSHPDKYIARSRVSSERCPVDGHNPNPSVCSENSRLAYSDETQQNQHFRHGRVLFKHLPQIFRKSRQNNRIEYRSTKKWLSRVGGLFRRKSNITRHRSTMESVPPSNLGPRCTMRAYNVDGACDGSDNTSTMNAINLNKALPPDPLSTRDKILDSSQAGTLSPPRSHKSDARGSPTSITYSEFSRASSKNRFHHIIHELNCPSVMEVREPSLLKQHDSDSSLVGAKYDPLAALECPDTPMTLSGFNNNNPFMDQYDQFIPPLPMPATPNLTLPDPLKRFRANGISQSHSESQIRSPKMLQIESYKPQNLAQHSGSTKDRFDAESRGRTHNRGSSESTTNSPNCQGSGVADRKELPERSRSPVKRLLGLGKSQSLKKMPQEKDPEDEIEKKVLVKLWGDRLRHGFLTNTESKPGITSSPSEAPSLKTRHPSIPPKSTFPISLPADRQAKVQCEMELMICVTANSFLKSEAEAGRMSAESVAKIMTQWSCKNRPQVLEFQFDQATQRDLVLFNINTLHLHGEAATNRLVLNSTMYAWKVIAKEMSVRTFCLPDSVIRKHLHDAHKVLELLGASLSTFLALQELQVQALKEIADVQRGKRERQERRAKERE